MSGGAVLLKGGWVLSLDPRGRELRRRRRADRQGVVLEVGPGLRRRDAEVVDATDCIVMPGFVDTHRHAWKSLVRNLGDGGPEPRRSGRRRRLRAALRPDDVYAATLVGLLGAVEAGITTVVDWSDIHLDERYTDAALQAHADAGLRTVFVRASPPWAATDGDRGRPGRPGCPPSRRDRLGHPKSADHGRLRPRRRRAGTDLDGFAAEVAAARAVGCASTPMPVMEQADRGSRRRPRRTGGYSAKTSPWSTAPARRRGPDRHRQLWRGGFVDPVERDDRRFRPAAVQRLIDKRDPSRARRRLRGVAPGDMFAQMRAVISLQHATYFDLKLAGRAGLPNLCDP